MLATAARTIAKSGARALSTGAAKAAKHQRTVLGASAVAVGIAAGVAGYKSECLQIEIDDATAKSLLAAIKAGSNTGARYNELLPSPAGGAASDPNPTRAQRHHPSPTPATSTHSKAWRVVIRSKDQVLRRRV
jgi:hypothetical protein